MKNRYYIYLLLFIASCTPAIKPVEKSINIPFREIYKYGEMANATYFNDFYVIKKYQPEFEVRIFEIEDIDVKYIVLKSHLKRNQYIIIRGTDNLENAITDLQYLKKLDPRTGNYYHSGFLEASNYIFDHLTGDDSRILSDSYRTYIIGHSLGGAIAGILGSFFYEEKKLLGLIITFGQPKYTNKEGLLKYKNLPYIRIVNQGDIVPLVPPTSILSVLDGEYKHGGLEVLLTNSGEVKYSKVGTPRHESQEPSFWDTLFNEEINVEKHLMAPYLEKIRRHMDENLVVRFEDGYVWQR